MKAQHNVLPNIAISDEAINTSDFVFRSEDEPTRIYDTDQLEDAVAATLIGWKLTDIRLIENTETGLKFGHFYFDAPERVDLRNFDRHLQKNTLVIPIRVGAIGRTRKYLRQQVEKLKRSEYETEEVPVSRYTTTPFEPRDL